MTWLTTPLRLRHGLSLLAACASVATSLGAQRADTAGVGAALAAFQSRCRETAASLWGTRLCGGIVLVDPSSRVVVTNRRLPDAGLSAAGSLWVGRLPDSVMVANTAFQWHGEALAMVMLPLSSDDFDRTTLLAHESFHRIQKSLGLWIREQPSVHLDERAGRTWLRLEVQALAYALTTRGEAQRAHARAALAFRAHRQRLFPDARAREDSLELQEGLAEHAGQVVASARSTLGTLRTVRTMDGVMRRPSYVRSFAYATGPAYGLLLDQFAPGWRTRIARVRSLAGLLTAALGTPLRDTTESALVALAQPYGYPAVDAAEADREARRNAQLAAVRTTLVDGPVVRLTQRGVMRSFDPNTLIAMDSLGMAYPTGEFGAAWGKLVVSEGSDGALLSSDFALLRIAGPPAIDGRTVRGKGWVLELAEGWQLVPGARAGDFEVRGRP